MTEREQGRARELTIPCGECGKLVRHLIVCPHCKISRCNFCSHQHRPSCESQVTALQEQVKVLTKALTDAVADELGDNWRHRAKVALSLPALEASTVVQTNVKGECTERLTDNSHMGQSERKGPALCATLEAPYEH